MELNSVQSANISEDLNPDVGYKNKPDIKILIRSFNELLLSTDEGFWELFHTIPPTHKTPYIPPTHAFILSII